jgi:hypothetical protein
LGFCFKRCSIILGVFLLIMNNLFR